MTKGASQQAAYGQGKILRSEMFLAAAIKIGAVDFNGARCQWFNRLCIRASVARIALLKVTA